MTDVTSWKAIYNDGTYLDKTISPGKENLFSSIQEDKLQEFIFLYNGRVISVFLKDGTFGINGLLYKTDISGKPLKYRVIHYTTRTKVLGSSDEDSNTYFVGFQTTIDGRNVKRLMQISDRHISFVSV